MKWITAFSRTPMRQLVAHVSDAAGNMSVMPIRDIDYRIDAQKYGSPRHLQFNASQFGRTTCNEYRKGPLAGLAAANQGVFEGTVNGLRLLIPAQTLVRALFGSHVRLRAWLMHPNGLNIGALQVEKLLGRKAFTPKATFAWLTSNPDTQASWASVFANALSGQLDLTPPDEVCNFSVWGFDIEGTLHVTHLVLMEVQHADSTRAIRPKNGIKTGNYFDARVSRVTSTGRLTDAQWRLICGDLREAFPPIGGKPAYTLRQRFEMLLFKRGSRLRWNALNWPAAALASAQRFSSRLNKTDLWDRLMDRLTAAAEGDGPELLLGGLEDQRLGHRASANDGPGPKTVAA